jgi:hypothetical protein
MKSVIPAHDQVEDKLRRVYGTIKTVLKTPDTMRLRNSMTIQHFYFKTVDPRLRGDDVYPIYVYSEQILYDVCFYIVAPPENGTTGQYIVRNTIICN